MKQYLEIIRRVADTGTPKEDRTGTGTLSIFGHQSRYDLREGFPLVTTKKMFLRGIIVELLWIISGSTNVKVLQDQNVHIWDEWADANGDLGPVYGHQWRAWPGTAYFESAEPVFATESKMHFTANIKFNPIDQLKNVIERLKTDPDCRRLIVSAWNPADVDKMALAPCHCFFQFYTRKIPLLQRVTACPVARAQLLGTSLLGDAVRGDVASLEKVNGILTESGSPERFLDCQMYQRSADLFLGVPFNVASYALLTMMVAQVCNMIPGEFIHTFGDAHLYNNHTEQAQVLLSREPKKLPKMLLNRGVKDINHFVLGDFRLYEYESWPALHGEVSV